jgi:hypothetical protein
MGRFIRRWWMLMLAVVVWAAGQAVIYRMERYPAPHFPWFR